MGPVVLFAPADRERRVARALAGTAESVVLDLEDAVAPAARGAARARLVAALSGSGRAGVYVRVNEPAGADLDPDLEAVAQVAGSLAGVVVPKVESAAELDDLALRLTGVERTAGLPEGFLALVPIVESPRGLRAVDRIAAAPRVRSLVFGTLDLAASMGVEPTPEGREFLHARSEVVLASRLAGIEGPVDGPHGALSDEKGLRASAVAARSLGFRGKVVIHPDQIEPVRQEFSTTEEELARAQIVVDAFVAAGSAGEAAVRLPDGTFVERPVVARAAALLGIDVVLHGE